MNGVVYAPVRGKTYEPGEWIQWENAEATPEAVERKLRIENERYERVMKAWPLLRIAKFDAREVKG